MSDTQHVGVADPHQILTVALLARHLDKTPRWVRETLIPAGLPVARVDSERLTLMDVAEEWVRDNLQSEKQSPPKKPR